MLVFAGAAVFRWLGLALAKRHDKNLPRVDQVRISYLIGIGCINLCVADSAAENLAADAPQTVAFLHIGGSESLDHHVRGWRGWRQGQFCHFCSLWTPGRCSGRRSACRFATGRGRNRRRHFCILRGGLGVARLCGCRRLYGRSCLSRSCGWPLGWGVLRAGIARTGGRAAVRRGSR